ncbi:hypothetical protein [Zobellia roscoffensis]|uniref:hypothetical protein n=1 Tax=Zobellia roscoffensis TaxID=2779508 RepID=UPI00188B6C0B|nr:hypothetical protein [Zobellia roscoffensis]
MIANRYLRLSLFFLCPILFSCSSSDGDNGGNETPQDILPPKASVLVFPDKGEECNQGDIISATQSRVTFEWETSENTDSYTLVLKNLKTNETTENEAPNNSLALSILRNTPYSWSIISKSSGTASTATSETWMFYNSGEGTENYAPFPAEAINPTMGATVASPTTLHWLGSDVDNDIVSYELYLGTNNPPTKLLETTADTSLENTALSGNTVYFWRVKTIDAKGSSSQSPVFEFKTE